MRRRDFLRALAAGAVSPLLGAQPRQLGGLPTIAPPMRTIGLGLGSEWTISLGPTWSDTLRRAYKKELSRLVGAPVSPDSAICRSAFALDVTRRAVKGES